jgi:dihydroorotate dehydrogenase (NAD+) catalytic subunit
MVKWDKIAGIEVDKPVMLAAGILGETYDSLKRVESSGAGALVTKSIGPEPNPGYPGPITVEVEGGFLNAVGLANPGFEAFGEELSEGKGREQFNVPLLASIYGADADDFTKIVGGLEPHVDGFELNLSCPHSKRFGLAVGSDPELVQQILRECRQRTEKPLVAKLSPNVPRIDQVARSAERGGADAICAINTVGPGMAIEVESMRPVLSNGRGGLSGPCIKPIAVRCIYDIYEAIEVPIIGVGGVTSGRDAVELMEAGATWVQLGTALYLGRLSLFREVVAGLGDFLEKHGLSHGELVGSAHPGR